MHQSRASGASICAIMVRHELAAEQKADAISAIYMYSPAWHESCKIAPAATQAARLSKKTH